MKKQLTINYEEYAAHHGCDELRIDTNARNHTARQFYRKLGYREIAVVPANASLSTAGIFVPVNSTRTVPAMLAKAFFPMDVTPSFSTIRISLFPAMSALQGVSPAFS